MERCAKDPNVHEFVRPHSIGKFAQELWKTFARTRLLLRKKRRFRKCFLQTLEKPVIVIVVVVVVVVVVEEYY